MKARVAKAFAPATITNFFAVHYDKNSDEDLSHAGATGGGYILSRGTVTKVTASGEPGPVTIEIVVNGDPSYDARTTGDAIKLMLKQIRPRASKLLVEQVVDVPIGHGFGASAASALSGVFAASAALDIRLPKEQVAYFAHAADIRQETGLGTVSAAYDGRGAGIIFEPGAPGIAKFMNVEIPADIKIITASLAPQTKSSVLSSQESVVAINKFGSEALGRVMREPTIERLAVEGEWFSEKVGLMTEPVEALVKTAKSAGAVHASQNMIGQAMHAVVPAGRASAVALALASSSPKPRVDIFEVGSEKAGVIGTAELRYPTVTSSFV